jgi:uncharacterized protein
VTDEAFKPTAGMQEAADRALRWHEEGHPGGTIIGLGRARDIVAGRVLSQETVDRMHSFFARHEVDKQAEGFNAGEDGFPSPGRVAWDLWGGDAGQVFAAANRSENEERNVKYSSEELEEAAKAGEAMPDGSYPIKDEDDLLKAIHAVGRGSADHDAIRRHIMDRAKALGLTELVPENWNDDGSLRSRRKGERHRAVPLLPEVRHFNAGELEVRAADTTGDTVTITGSPIVYNRDYVVYDMFGEFNERMAPGVAAHLLTGTDCRFLFNHDGMPLARTTSGTLTLSDSPDALRFSATLDLRQSVARDLMIAIERGDVSQMSCGFVVARDEWDDSMENRTIHQFADLLDVSAVTYPASPTTSIEIAQRLALEMPVESRARARRLYSELRAGKVLSNENEDHVKKAASALAIVLDNAGVDWDNDPEGEDATSEDGTQGGGSEAVEGGDSAADGAGSRDVDVPVEQREDPVDDTNVDETPHTRTSSVLKLQVKAHELARKR